MRHRYFRIWTWLLLGSLSPHLAPASPAPDGAYETEVMDEKGRWPSEIRREWQELREKAVKKQETQAASRAALADAIALPLPQETCLAFLRADGECLLTVGAFNGNIDRITRNRPDSLTWSASDIPPLRHRLLAGLRDGIFLEGLMHDSAMGGLRRQVDEALKQRASEMAKGAERQQLLRLYKQYHQELFAEKWKTSVKVLASTDSSFLDSLRQKCIKDAPNPRASEQRGPGNQDSTKIYLWQPAALETLPAKAAAAASVLRPGEMSPPIACGYGWMVLSLTGKKRVPAIPFDLAVPTLVSLASQPPGAIPAATDSVRGNQPVLPPAPSESPIDLRVWLIPHFRTVSRAFVMPRWRDTLAVSPQSLGPANLPADLRAEVRKALRNRTEGIFKHPSGIWYVKAPRRISASEAEDNLIPAESTPPEQALLRQALDHARSKERDFKAGAIQNLLPKQNAPGSSRGQTHAFDKEAWIKENLVFEESLLDQ
jgi:hypothetical protein